MKHRLFLLFTLISVSVISSSFSQTESGKLEKLFKNYKVINLPSSSIKSEIASQRSEEKKIKIANWELTLFDSEIINKNYKLMTAIPDFERRSLPLAMNGYTRWGGRVSLTINDNFVYGFIKENDETFYIEPLYHFEKSAKIDQFIIYNEKDIIEQEIKSCGVSDSQRIHEKHEDEKSNRNVGECFEVDYAIASDFLMFQQYGSVAGVENHAVGVTNDIQTNYDNEFADELQFSIITQFVSNCNTCDPWTSSTEAGELLASFRSWGPSGFGVQHDIGSIWTGRNFNGSTIGIAYVGAVCTSFRYNALEDFSSNANLKRVMVAHELGHNFDAEHDASGSPFIMAPSVQNTSSWSSASITSIQNHYNGAGCLANCIPSGGPTANFSYVILEECTPGQVKYTNISAGSITNYFWEFEGGSPATSTQANPLVNYPSPGLFDVKLTVTDGFQSSTLELNDEIQIDVTPVANFDYNILNNSVNFQNLSNELNGASFLWNFGDNSTSTDVNPVHTYVNDGTYTVSLEMNNVCGTSIFNISIVVLTAPTAGFTSNVNSGCGTFVVNYTNTSSSNATSFNWIFQGGNPATSTQQNPIVTYSTPGSFQVSLTSNNAIGSDTKTFNNYINSSAAPVSDFTFIQNGQNFTFTNTSTNANSYLWNFGDGTTSTNQNPTHTYSNSGNYVVTLIASNQNCPQSVSSSQITATSAPVSSFSTINGNTGCATFTASFASTSQNSPNSFLWSFVGGNPSTSTSPNPVVSYQNVGNFDVSLITTNAFGSDTLTLPNYIQVSGVPSSNISYTNNGLTYTFSSNANNAQNLFWNFGDGNTSTNVNPTHTYANQGNYVVSLESTNICGANNETENLSAYLLPQANASASSNTICANQSITYTDASTGTISSRAWTFVGGSPSTASSAIVDVSYASSGSYPVKLIVFNAAGSDTFEFIQNVIVINTPVAIFTEQFTNTSVECINTSSSGNSIEWSGPGGIGNGNQYTFTPPSNGIYNVTMIAKNGCGNDTLTKTINYNGYAVASVNSSANGNPICTNSSVYYNAAQIWNATYQWSFPGGTPATSSSQNPLVEYNSTGIYNATLIVTNPNGADTSELMNYITVIGKPEANFTEVIEQGNVSFNYTGQGAVGYLWNFAGLGTSVERNPKFVFTTSGIYPVSFIVNNICGQDTIIKNLNIIVSSVEDEFLKNNVSIYPNPTSDKITIELSNLLIDEKHTLTLIDNVGKKILNTNIKSKKEIIDLSDLSSGIYTLMVNSSKGRIAFKVSKI